MDCWDGHNTGPGPGEDSVAAMRWKAKGFPSGCRLVEYGMSPDDVINSLNGACGRVVVGGALPDPLPVPEDVRLKRADRPDYGCPAEDAGSYFNRWCTVVY